MSDVNINPEKYEPLSWGEKISKGDLEYLYCECYKSLKDIGRIFDCSIHKVRMNMEYWGIERRDPSRKTKSYYIDDILTEDFLKRKYCWSGENMNLSEIASETGFSENNVYTRLEKYNIEKFDIPKKIIVEKYIEEEESIHRVSEDLDVSVTTVLNKMDEYDIDTRNPGFSGEDHPFYGKTMGEERRKSQSKKMKELWEKSPERFEGTFESPSKEVREKMSVSAKKRVERQGIVTSYNSEACSVIDEFGEENGYNFQHAENGDEFQIGRYFVDGYDRDENIVVEYMEKHHIYTEEEDKDRRRFIINELGCSFVEIWYDGSIEKFN